MFIKTFPVGLFLSNIYLVMKDKNQKEAILIDCGDLSNSLINFLEENKIVVKYVFLTHGHFDHIGACLYFQKKGAKIYSHKGDDPKIKCEDLRTNIINMKLEPFFSDYSVKDNEEFNILDLNIKVLHTPGHSKGSCSYIINDEVIFTGDTLFKLSFGRFDFPDSDAKELFNSLKRLLSLKKDYIVYPGHGETTTIFEEKENNPFDDYFSSIL